MSEIKTICKKLYKYYNTSCVKITFLLIDSNKLLLYYLFLLCLVVLSKPPISTIVANAVENKAKRQCSHSPIFRFCCVDGFGSL